MRLFLCLIALLLVGGSVAVEIPFRGHDRESGKITKTGSRPLRIAIVRMKSLNHDIDGNLRQATAYAEEAAAQGAKLVLFPELMPTGSYLAADTWDFAEPTDGKTVQWLKATSRRLHIWIGTGFFEADGEDFYDTFVLTTPEGEEAGRVRKAAPAEGEAYFFRGYDNPHVINTAIGRIGIGICAESYYCLLPTHLIKRSADLILMPHSSPDMSKTGGLPSPPGTHLGSWYAKKLGIPVAMVNKVGSASTPPPHEINAFFPGRSAIVDSDGTAKSLMDDKEGIAVADVVLDPSRKRSPNDSPVCTGVGISDLTISGAAGQKKLLTRKRQERNPTTPIRYAKRRRLRFQASPEFSHCAPPRTIARLEPISS